MEKRTRITEVNILAEIFMYSVLKLNLKFFLRRFMDYIAQNVESRGLLKTPLIIVPTYNELENIKNLLPVLLDLQIKPDILVVDDQSPDGTGNAGNAWIASRHGLVRVVTTGEQNSIGRPGIEAPAGRTARVRSTGSGCNEGHPVERPSLVRHRWRGGKTRNKGGGPHHKPSPHLTRHLCKLPLCAARGLPAPRNNESRKPRWHHPADMRIGL